MKLLHNHLGYVAGREKVAIVEADGRSPGKAFALVDAVGRTPVLHRTLQQVGQVAGWRGRHYWLADFSEVRREGEYFLLLDGHELPVVSRPFRIVDSLYDEQIISNLLHYFKSQRCTGMYDLADRHCRKYGSDRRVDVHGGWYDASGDVSKYLSHLSYANFMNPQQTPQVVWNLIDGRARMAAQSRWFDERMVDEALHGADFLVRMVDPEGYFYATVFDRWSKDPGQRELCSYATQQGHKAEAYQAGFRQGAGSAIAALARASGLPRDGEFTRSYYLETAVAAFDHLSQFNTCYLPDGCENIIDDYCALLAAVELHVASGLQRFADAAGTRVRALLARQTEEGWFWADAARSRSYFHAVEAGMPFIALVRYLEALPNGDQAESALQALRRGVNHELGVTYRAGTNPFGYPRQTIVMPDKTPQVRFFMPHDNESGYWWQGENARLASLASAAQLVASVLAEDVSLAGSLDRYAGHALDWIFGRNPFDVCMMQGQGYHNPCYEPGFSNAPGGVCNGVTGGLDDEDDLDFRLPHQTVPAHSWRWSEQWMPHAAWLFHALAQQLGTQ